MKLIVAIWPTTISALPHETSQSAGRRSGRTGTCRPDAVGLTVRRVAQEHRPRERARGAGARKREIGPAEPRRVGEWRQRERRHEPTERHAGLTDPEREPALGRGRTSASPPAARRVDACAESPCRHQQEDELRVPGGDADACKRNRRGRRARRGGRSRSPTRSASRPQGSRVGVIPIVKAASTTPVWAIVSWNSARNSGASTATLNTPPRRSPAPSSRRRARSTDSEAQAHCTACPHRHLPASMLAARRRLDGRNETHRVGDPRECQGRLTCRRSDLPVGRLPGASDDLRHLPRWRLRARCSPNLCARREPRQQAATGMSADCGHMVALPMSKLRLTISMSLDGFVAGPGPERGQPARRSAACACTSGSSRSRCSARCTGWRAARSTRARPSSRKRSPTSARP